LFAVLLQFCNQENSASSKSSKLNDSLQSLLDANSFDGKIQEQLEVKLGRKLNPEKIELGKLVFFDAALALGQDNSCGGCHAPNFGFGDSQPIAIGVNNNGIV